MAKNEFKPFAIGEYANVLSQEEYETLPAIGAGYTAGIAKSEQLNKTWRQSSVMVAALGELVSERIGEDVLDDGDLAKLLDQLKKAISISARDAAHPVGIVALFAENKNPNNLYPGTSWEFIGEGRNIRIGKADGSDILSVGGNDNVNISVQNLPPHGHSFSANTDSFDYGSKQTDIAGKHNHTTSGRRGTLEEINDYIAAGAQGSLFSAITSDSGDHAHQLNIGPHSHYVSGNTSDTGSGNPFSVVNAFIRLMAWRRTA